MRSNRFYAYNLQLAKFTLTSNCEWECECDCGSPTVVSVTLLCFMLSLSTIRSHVGLAWVRLRYLPHGVREHICQCHSCGYRLWGPGLVICGILMSWHRRVPIILVMHCKYTIDISQHSQPSAFFRIASPCGDRTKARKNYMFSVRNAHGSTCVALFDAIKCKRE